MARRAEHMGYWPQQLNFAVWCATTGCRIFREVLDKVPEQMKSLQMFRIYFIVRWIIFEMGGFQAIRLLARWIKYDKPSFKQILAEFGISLEKDFGFKWGDNQSWTCFHSCDRCWPAGTLFWYYDKNKLSDEGGKAIKGNLIFFTWLRVIFGCVGLVPREISNVFQIKHLLLLGSRLP